MGVPQSSHLPPQLLSPPSLPKPSLFPQSNHHEAHTSKPFSNESVRDMVPMDGNDRSAKRQKLELDGNLSSREEVAFFDYVPDNLSSEV